MSAKYLLFYGLSSFDPNFCVPIPEDLKTVMNIFEVLLINIHGTLTVKLQKLY